jgi:hypothetical protein
VANLRGNVQSPHGFWLGSNDALGVLYNGHAGLRHVALNVPDVTVIPN